MKVRHIVAGILAFTITAVSGTSVADSMRTYVSQPMTNIPTHHGHVTPRATTSISVVGDYGLGMRPAIRVDRHGARYHQDRFEKRWGKNWNKHHNYKVIVVRPGDTLSKIAARRGTTVSRLMRLNNMSAYEANHIEIGQLLRVS